MERKDRLFEKAGLAEPVIKAEGSVRGCCASRRPSTPESFGPDFSESGNLAPSGRATTRAGQQKAAHGKWGARGRRGTCCFGFTTEREVTKEKTERERVSDGSGRGKTSNG